MPLITRPMTQNLAKSLAKVVPNMPYSYVGAYEGARTSHLGRATPAT